MTSDCVQWENNYAAFVHRLSPKINETQIKLLPRVLINDANEVNFSKIFNSVSFIIVAEVHRG